MSSAVVECGAVEELLRGRTAVCVREVGHVSPWHRAADDSEWREPVPLPEPPVVPVRLVVDGAVLWDERGRVVGLMTTPGVAAVVASVYNRGGAGG